VHADAPPSPPLQLDDVASVATTDERIL
jgi:hypothetical protein